jgi:Protein of unknown function (DUF4246)
LAELQDKARVFKESGIVLVMNIASGICKSDGLLPQTRRADLREGIAPLLANSDSCWAIKAKPDQQELCLVDPSMFPLEYGKTRVLTSGGAVGLDNCIASCGKGNLAPDYGNHQWDTYDRGEEVREMESNRRPTSTPFWTFEGYGLSRFSSRFQWLPFDVKFTGQSSCEVQVTSYINNLHPVHFKGLYLTIEGLISLAIKPWNEILIKGKDGRWPRRINTWGLKWESTEEDWPSSKALLELEKDRASAEFNSIFCRIQQYLSLPETYPKEQTLPDEYNLRTYRTWRSKTIPEDWQSSDGGLSTAIRAKWARLYHWDHPDAGVAFTYEHWMAGQTSNAILKHPYHECPNHNYCSVSLQEEFQETGLQIIAKVVSIDLTPEMPISKGGVWQMEATLNENIVATAAFFYDTENITDSRTSLRQQTKMDKDDFVYVEHEFEQLVEVFAIPEEGGFGPAYQELGSISTPEGHLVAWPNTLHHRFEPFKLLDESQPGHQRFHYSLFGGSTLPNLLDEECSLTAA